MIEFPNIEDPFYNAVSAIQEKNQNNMKIEYNYSKRPPSIWDYIVPILCGIGILCGLIAMANLHKDKESAKNPMITPQELRQIKATTEPTQAEKNGEIKTKQHEQ